MLSMLALMSIEHKLLRGLDFTKTIEEFALAKARKTAILISSTSAVVGVTIWRG